MAEPIQESFSDMLDRLTRTHGPASEAPEPEPNEIAPRSPAKVVSLPEWAAHKRGTPHSALRSALFAAVNQPRYMEGELLAAQDGIEVRFTGKHLNQSDLDVWQQVVHLAHPHPLGTQCEFTMREFLRGMGRTPTNHRWLWKSPRRLTACAVEIKQGGHTYAGSLIEFDHAHMTGHCTVKLNERLIDLFTPGDWTAIGWQQRHHLRRKRLALWLHGYYVSHVSPYSVSVEYLHDLSGSNTKSMRKFKQNLVLALKELKTVGAIRSFKIDDNLVSVEKRPVHDQRKYMQRAKRREVLMAGLSFIMAGATVARVFVDFF